MFLVSVLISALVKSVFVSRMQIYFYFQSIGPLDGREAQEGGVGGRPSREGWEHKVYPKSNVSVPLYCV